MSTMRDTSKMLSDDDRETLEKSYRKLERVNACIELLDFFDSHERCVFEVGGKRMSGRAIADSVVGASDARLRTFHSAAQQHRQGKGRRS